MTSVWVAEQAGATSTGRSTAAPARSSSLELRCRADEAIGLVERAAQAQGIVPGQLVLGTDNGSAFTARRFTAVLSGLGIAHRRGGYRDPESQAFIESWFGKLKERLIWRSEFETLDQARAAVGAYVDRYHEHPHAGDRLIEHLSALGRKPTTMNTYRSLLVTHLDAHLGDRTLDRVGPEHVEAVIVAMRRDGAGAKTIVNAITLLHQIFAFAERKGWCAGNPCKNVDRPSVEESTDIRFLDHDELEALLRSVDVDDAPIRETDRTIFLVAAMTGLRQGELLALRWRDVDWPSRKIRVRQNFVRGHWGTPKSKRGARSVPMADRVGAELERHFQRSAYQGDDDLVFCHPRTGRVLDHSSLVRRFKKALAKASVRSVRFNDLRHTFGTRMAAAGVPLRTLQEWMGHRDFKTTLIYADYCPSAHEAELVERAFAAGTNAGTNLSETEQISDDRNPLHKPNPT